MSVPAINTVAWFEVASDDPAAVRRFYGDLFGWRFQIDEDSAAGGVDYQIIRYSDDEKARGGVFSTGGSRPGHAVFTVLVADVTATCERVESLGGKVVSQVVGNAHGPDLAYVQDTSGNLVQIFAEAGS
ncbi:VOC family protein [Planotetraspora mira]|uniref:Glyoxalase n=1 Tax=Planotetraspora mira TaxID=58121 RepID=A0A8J3TKT8_9ACTN|nr:VOC family protein [Planotetraspora mira]GII27587.1 glyoxalase [Planotetraspora mira]